MGWVWTILVGALIGAVSGLFSKKRSGFIYNVIAGLIGSSLGGYLFGGFGPELAGMYIVPAVLGAVIFNVLVNLVLGR